MTLVDFQMKWQHWQQEVQQMIAQGVFCETMTQVAQVIHVKYTQVMLSSYMFSYHYAQLLQKGFCAVYDCSNPFAYKVQA